MSLLSRVMGEGNASRAPWFLELFVASNLGFLAIDVYTAHSVNAFAHAQEWLPIIFSAAVPFLLIPAWRRNGGQNGMAGKWLGFLLGGTSILIGIAGMVYHLADTFFVQQTLKNLVYTAPFAAPLAYTGLGFLLWLNRMESAENDRWGSWVLLMALGGFIGNFALALADHAQNGFFARSEWIAVWAAALGVGFLLVATFYKKPGKIFFITCSLVMLFEILIGVAGFYFHFSANLHAAGGSLRDRFIFGAPVFAPLLFADLAILALLGLAQRYLQGESEGQEAQS